MNGLLFETVLKRKLDLFRGKRLLAAFSGGKDSLAMLDFFNINKDDFGYSLYACHINHGLRKESGVDEEFCRKWCSDNGVSFSVQRLLFSANEASKGIEDWARRQRYIVLEKEASEKECDYILTAHTFDDRLESFFTDLYTGASIFTLGGISFIRGKVCRPMLEVNSSDVEDYLLRRGLEPVFDASNDDLRFVRNKIRHKVMPSLFDAGDEFINTVLRLQEDSAALGQEFDSVTAKAVLSDNREVAVIDGKIFGCFSDMQKRYLLGKLFSERCRASKAVIDIALNLFERQCGSRRVSLPGGFIFEVSYDRVRIFKKSLIALFHIEKDEITDRINLLGGEVIFSGLYAKMPLVVRNRCNGDKFKGKKLKDLFINARMDIFIRDRAVIVENKNGEIIWVEGLSKADVGIAVKRFF